MRTYARVQDGVVAELLKTSSDVTQMFHPSLVWVDVSSNAAIREGWHFDGKEFSGPPQPSEPASGSTLADLQAQLVLLEAKFAALSAKK
jgi:hypothetical protein